MKLACRASRTRTATQRASATRTRSGGMVIGTTTKMISKASSTRALSAIPASTMTVALSGPPGMATIHLSISKSVPRIRNTRVKVVAATKRKNKAPVSASASRKISLRTGSANRPRLDGIKISGSDTAKQDQYRQHRHCGQDRLRQGRGRYGCRQRRVFRLGASIEPPADKQTGREIERGGNERAVEHVLRVDHAVFAAGCSDCNRMRVEHRVAEKNQHQRGRHHNPERTRHGDDRGAARQRYARGRQPRFSHPRESQHAGAY